MIRATAPWRALLPLCLTLAQCRAELGAVVKDQGRLPASVPALSFAAPLPAEVEAGTAFRLTVALDPRRLDGPDHVSVNAMSDEDCATRAAEGAWELPVNGGSATTEAVLTKAGLVRFLAARAGSEPACSPPVVVKPSVPALLSFIPLDTEAFSGDTALRIVVVTDRYGNPVPGAKLSVALSRGEGEIITPTPETDADGKAKIVWVMGKADVPQELSVSLLAGDRVVASEVVANTPRNKWCDRAAGHPVFQGGTGTVGEPFIICTPRQLAQVGLHPEWWDKAFRLEADVDLAGFDASDAARTFPPIGRVGTDASQDKAFTGTFDGNGHTVSRYVNQRPPQDYVAGFFGWAKGATIQNLVLADADVVTELAFFNGIVMGKGEDVTVRGVKVVRGSIRVAAGAPSLFHTGGLVGNLVVSGPGRSSVLRDVSVDAVVVGDDAVGGLIGRITATGDGTLLIEDVTVTGSVGNVPTGGNSIGGFVGYMEASAGTQATVRRVATRTAFDVKGLGTWTGGFNGTIVAGDAGTKVLLEDVRSEGAVASPARFFVCHGCVGGFSGSLVAQNGAELVFRKAMRIGNLLFDDDSDSYQLGGFVGSLGSFGTGSLVLVEDSGMVGDVNVSHPGRAQQSQGLFVGNTDVHAASSFAVVRSFATGSMNAGNGTELGQFIGRTAGSPPSVAQSFADADAAAVAVGTVGTLAGLQSRPRADLRKRATFVGWDFTTVWSILEDAGFPSLR